MAPPAFAHEGAFDEVDGGAVFVVDVAVDAAGFAFFEVVEAACDAAVGQFAGYFGDDVGGVGDEGYGFVPGGDGLHDFDEAAAVGFVYGALGQAVDDFFKAALVFAGEHFEDLAGVFGQGVAQDGFLFVGKGGVHGLLLVFGCG